MFRHLVACSALLAAAAAAPAQTSTWTNAVSGTFNVATNWTGGVPGTASTAVFNATPNAYTVTFTNSPTNSGLAVQNGIVTFALGGNTYTLTATNAVNIGNVANQTGQLTIGNGTLQGVTGAIGVNGGTGLMTVNAGAIWSNSANIAVGSVGTGFLTVNANGSASNTFSSIGTNVGGVGTATVASGTWTNNGSLVVGRRAVHGADLRVAVRRLHDLPGPGPGQRPGAGAVVHRPRPGANGQPGAGAVGPGAGRAGRGRVGRAPVAARAAGELSRAGRLIHFLFTPPRRG
jgi:fibronectin-binding autotransporter adhesin